MAAVTKPIALDETLQTTNTRLQTTNTTLGTLDTDLKKVAADTTLQATNTALGTLDTDLKKVAADATLQTTNTRLQTTNTTLQATNTALGLLAKDTTLSGSNSLLEAIANILISVRSVNGEYGVVVLDSGDILINKNVVSSKTVETVLSELEDAVANTPLTFTPTLISGDDYNITVTIGSP